MLKMTPITKLRLSCGVITNKYEPFIPKLETYAIENLEVVGVCGIVMRHYIFPTLYVAVDKKHRKKGIGTRLVKDIIYRARYPVFLTVWTGNPSYKIFKKFGFKKVCNWRKIRGVKTIVMVRL